METKQRACGHRVRNMKALDRFKQAVEASKLPVEEISELTYLSPATIYRLMSRRPKGQKFFLSDTIERAEEFASAYLPADTKPATKKAVESDSTQLDLPLAVARDPERKDRTIDELQRRVAALESSVSTLHAVVMRLVAAQGGMM